VKHRRSQDRDRVPKLQLALREINENLTFTESAAWVWFALPAQQWAFRSEAQRLNLLLDAGDAYATLSGHRLHLRVTSRPYPAASWARGLDQRTPAPLGGTQNDTWGDHLVRVQQHLRATTMAEKEVYLGVRLVDRRSLDLMLDRMLRRVVRREVDKATRQAERITEIVTSAGFAGRPASAAEMEWLMRRSVGLGLPAPGSLCPAPGGLWETEDLHSFTDSVRYEAVPFAPTVRVIGRLPDGTEVDRHVAVLSVGKMPEIEVPDSAHEPWIAHTDRLPFPVEWSSRVDVLTGPEAQQAIQRKLLVVRDMQRHYHEHDLDEPLMLERQARHARVVEDEMTQGADVVANRVHGWHRVAVWGATEEECLERARKVQATYRNRRIAIEHPRGQFGLLREFTPGEPLSSTAYKRRMPALYFAAALPTVSANLGDRRGPYIGYTCGSSRRAVMFDTHFATEVRETSGLVPVVGGLGAGKALALDTPLPTPTGWTTMGDVNVGDQLIGADGKPTRVLAATDVMHGRPCYEVEFSDGTVIVADANHQWLTCTRKAWKSGDKPEVHTTREIARTLRDGQQSNHAVAITAPFVLPGVDVPIDPYVLGVWLGDGHSYHAAFTSYDDEIVLAVQASGQRVTGLAREHQFGLPGLKGKLRDLDLLQNKHIPTSYLRASEDQRRALLAGLLDTDGHCDKQGRIEFSVTNARLARNTRELVLSLGYKATLRTKPCKGRSERSSTVYTVAFTTSDKVFRLSRKVARQNGSERATQRYRYIVDVRPIEPVPVRCVQVDNADHLYLAGETCVPTHNSVLMGLMTYEAVRRGIPSVMLDPSGPLARLTELPEMRDYARHIDLTQAPPGTLNPFAVVAAPRRDQFPDDDAFEEAKILAAQDRKLLALDVARMLLPPSLDVMPSTRIVLSDAVRATGGAPMGSLWTVIEQLESHSDPHGAVVANYLRDMAELPMARLFFPTGAQPFSRMDATLTVLTMPGLVLPPRNVPREHWSTSEQMAVPLLHLAAWYASRAIYGRDMHGRKVVALDEVHFLGEWSAGRALFTRLGRDSRKWNTCVFAASQNPKDVLGMDVANFIAAAFVGRIEDEENAADGLRMLRVPTGVGYERVLAMLSARQGAGRSAYREFVMRDVDGRVDKLRVDLSHNPGLLAALDTTAKPHDEAVPRADDAVDISGDDDEFAVA
jgi:hypothetical protein